MKAEHTTGPWTAYPPHEASNSSEYWEIEDTAGHTATVYGDDAEAAANAKLIAAAPDLLAVALHILSILEAPPPNKPGGVSREMLRAAIAKATL